jgi:molybdate transport system substrate-binding protein
MRLPQEGKDVRQVVAMSLVVAATASGCASAGELPDADGSVLVLAAASLTDVFGSLADVFEATHAGTEIRLNFAASSSLREQILGGLPGDVFASADETNVDEVVAAGDASGEPKAFARNGLAIAVPAGNPAGVNGIADLARSELLVGLCAETVPCGELARRAISVAGIEASVDTHEPDVRALLTKVEAGELDAAIVYATDVAAAAGRVDSVEIELAVEVTTTYAIVTLAAGANPDGAEMFVQFVLSAEGRSILGDHGFVAP